MKTTLNMLKASILGLALLVFTNAAFAQKGDGSNPKDKLKTEEGGKDKLKEGDGTAKTDGHTDGGKDALKGGDGNPKTEMKGGDGNPKTEMKGDGSTTGTAEGGTTTAEGGETGHGDAHSGGGHSDAGGSSTDATLGSVGADGVYARDKSNEGKPYDQARLDAAKSKANAVIAAVESLISSEEAHAQAAKDKIKAAEDAVAALKAEKKPDQAAISAKEELIRIANEKVTALEQQITAAKAAIAVVKATLTPATAAK